MVSQNIHPTPNLQMTKQTTSLTNLPTEILLIIGQKLPIIAFYRLCYSAKTFKRLGALPSLSFRQYENEAKRYGNLLDIYKVRVKNVEINDEVFTHFAIYKRKNEFIRCLKNERVSFNCMLETLMLLLQLNSDTEMIAEILKDKRIDVNIVVVTF
jgi:hypothetical protein